MQHFFFQCIKKAIHTIRKEPLIVLIFTTFYLVGYFFSQLSSSVDPTELTQPLTQYAIVEWFIPVIILQPILLIVVHELINQRPIHYTNIINRYFEILPNIFFVGILFKPLMVIGRHSFITKYNNRELDAVTQSSELFTFDLGLLFFGLILNFLFIYLLPMIITTRKPQSFSSLLVSGTRHLLSFK